MKKQIISSLFIHLFFFLQPCFAQQNELVINLKNKGADVPSSMYGVFFEEINHAGDGGLYAEMVKNRSFEELEMPVGYSTKNDRLIPIPVVNHITGKNSNGTYEWPTEQVPGWHLKTETPSIASMRLTKENPYFPTASTNLKITINDASKPVLLVNDGYWGMAVQKGENYNLRAIIKTAGYKGKVTVKLIAGNGNVLASNVLYVLTNGKWNNLQSVLIASATDTNAKLVLEFNAKGTINIDYVSLFPEETFNHRKNGLRNDVATMIAGVKPAFMRWPGGCVVEGITIGNRFEWKKTLGDPAARSGEYSTWGYRCSYGFGYYEYLQYCEDIGAKAMFVCSVGIGCQYRSGDACSKDSVGYYLNDCLDAIEYALGDAKTKWGAKRVASGHAKPFPLVYVEIGNENSGNEYDKRFDLFYTTIKKKYPQLILISNHGLGGIDKVTKTDRIDPHFYVSPDYFYGNANLFDNQPRGKYTVYVGEYACNTGVGAGNMNAALSEAAFISGMERNSDLVKMASYAPLLENKNKRNWATNLIWLDNHAVVGRGSYYVQQLFAENRPSYNIKSNITQTSPKVADIMPGVFGLGSWQTMVEYKEIKLTQGGNTQALNIADNNENAGIWTLKDGVLAQTSLQSPAKKMLTEIKTNDYTLEFKARKTAGDEGFIVYFGIDQNTKKGFAFNIGGWNNSRTAVESITGGNIGGTLGKSVNQTIETGKWYDVKLVGTPSSVSLYMDGQLINTYVHTTQPEQFFATGYDEATGEIIIKVVNATDKDFSQQIKLAGVAKIEKSGKVITLAAESGEAENSFDNPQKIYPKTTTFSQFGNDFKYIFPPFSFTVLRIKATR